MKAVVAAFNQEKALVGAFSVIVQLHRLIDLRHYLERLLGPAAAVLQTVLVADAALQPQDGLVHVDTEVRLVDQPHHQVIREAWVGMFNLQQTVNEIFSMMTIEISPWKELL